LEQEKTVWGNMKRTALFAFALVVLAMYLMRTHLSTQVSAGPTEDIKGLPQVQYIIPPIVTLPNGSIPHGMQFDWLGGESCCDTTRQDALVINSVTLAPRTIPGYTFIPNPNLDYVSAVKSATNMTREGPKIQEYVAPPLYRQPLNVPAYLSYQAAIPTFWWGWRGGQRTIFTSDGFYFDGAPSRNAPVNATNGIWYDTTPNRGLFGTITNLRYNAQEYVLDASRNVDL
jgi:hypothetical protein